MKRREFITAFGCATAWPFAARAQPALPVIGYLNGASANKFAHLLTAFQRGLSEAGYVEGHNLVIEYRWAEGQYERLPALAADLAQRRVAVIVATAGTPTVIAARAATSTIPIVFVVGSDPVKFGIVASLNHPGGNATGMTLLGPDTVAKRLGLLHELIPTAESVGVLANPTNPSAQSTLTDLEVAAATLGVRLQIVNSHVDNEFESAFTLLTQHRVGALVVSDDPFFDDRRAILATLSASYKIPTIYIRREFVEDGGLMSYGPKLSVSFRQAGNYVGRILKGEKAADLPVQAPTQYELVINLKTAKALGLEIPATLLARVDEVIE